MTSVLVMTFGSDSKSKGNKSKKKNKGGYIELKSFCMAKENINKMRTTSKLRQVSMTDTAGTYPQPRGHRQPGGLSLTGKGIRWSLSCVKVLGS